VFYHERPAGSKKLAGALRVRPRDRWFGGAVFLFVFVFLFLFVFLFVFIFILVSLGVYGHEGVWR